MRLLVSFLSCVLSFFTFLSAFFLFHFFLPIIEYGKWINE